MKQAQQWAVHLNQVCWSWKAWKSRSDKPWIRNVVGLWCELVLGGFVFLQVPGHRWSRSHGGERPLCWAGQSPGDAEQHPLQPHEANVCVLSHADHGSQPAHPSPAEEEKPGQEEQAGNRHGESGDQVQTQNHWPDKEGGNRGDPDWDTHPLSGGGEGLVPLLLLTAVSWPHHGVCQQYSLYQEVKLPAGYLGLWHAASSCQHAPETPSQKSGTFCWEGQVSFAPWGSEGMYLRLVIWEWSVPSGISKTAGEHILA